jgi:hypothetical protein
MVDLANQAITILKEIVMPNEMRMFLALIDFARSVAGSGFDRNTTVTIRCGRSGSIIIRGSIRVLERVAARVAANDNDPPGPNGAGTPRDEGEYP